MRVALDEQRHKVPQTRPVEAGMEIVDHFGDVRLGQGRIRRDEPLDQLGELRVRLAGRTNDDPPSVPEAA